MSAPATVHAPGGFHPRTAEDEAKPQAMEVLRGIGIAQHMQAALYHGLAQEVVGSKNPKLVSLQPTVSGCSEETWARAYDFVNNCLFLHGMTLSLSSLCVEFPGFKSLELRETFSNLDRDRYFHELLGIDRVTCAEKVSAFRGAGRRG
jgi:hypothetical protein